MHIIKRKITKESGFNLIELMIASAFGLVVTAGAITIFLATANSNRDVLNAIKLNQELRGAMSFMVRDLRRAGSWNYANRAAGLGISDNPFNEAGSFSGTLADGSPCISTTADCTFTCVEFTYDFPEDPNKDQDNPVNQANGKVNVDNSDFFGFGLKENAIKIKVANNHCPNMVNWQDITDDSVVTITNFQIIDKFPESYGGTQIRLLEIRLTGELVKDPSVKRDLVEFVRIRNDFLEP